MAIRYQKDWINEEWNQPGYLAAKEENFQAVLEYLDDPPTTILDIGCGLAFESRRFNQEYGSRLWLLDGNFDDSDHSRQLVQARYNQDVNDFSFYYNLDVLEQHLMRLGTQDYTLINARQPDISPDIKFDLITSWMSCGFHYPVNTYRDLIKRHSHDNTVVIMDLRLDHDTKEIISESGVEIVSKILPRRKSITCHIGLS